MRRRLALLIQAAFGALAAFASPARADRALLPAELIALDSPEGQRLLLEASAREDFFHLAETFVTQERPSYCGVASGVMVLNALPIASPPAEPGPMFTQINVFNDAAKRVHPPEDVARGGMTLEQLGAILQSHPTEAKVIHASDTTLAGFRATVAKNLGEPSNYVIVNYQRSEVGQESMGHISPLGAYSEKADRFLLLDVARYKYPPVWVSAEALFRAMNTSDPSSGKSRGFVLISPSPTAPPPGPRVAARSPMMMFYGALGVAFFVGVGLGAGGAVLVGRRRRRREAR